MTFSKRTKAVALLGPAGLLIKDKKNAPPETPADVPEPVAVPEPEPVVEPQAEESEEPEPTGADRSNKKVYGAMYRPSAAHGFGSLPKDLIDRMLAERATASFEASGVGYKTSTAAVVTFGVFGLGAHKKTGHLYIYFAKDGVDIEVWEAHKNAETIARKWVVVYNAEVQKRIASDPAPEVHAAPAAPAADDPAVVLKKLSALHDEGLLTDDEFEAKRAEVIGRL